jgi:hypothetical protein
VLELCAKAGLVKVGIVAVDGTKIAAAATHHATRSYEQIAAEILAEAARTDAAEDELYATSGRSRVDMRSSVIADRTASSALRKEDVVLGAELLDLARVGLAVCEGLADLNEEPPRSRPGT